MFFCCFSNSIFRLLFSILFRIFPFTLLVYRKKNSCCERFPFPPGSINKESLMFKFPIFPFFLNQSSNHNAPHPSNSKIIIDSVRRSYRSFRLSLLGQSSISIFEDCLLKFGSLCLVFSEKELNSRIQLEQSATVKVFAARSWK
ncbi:uncharacterized protein [Cicer arietinum]|uniref:Uncharacterized protein LOC113785363 n=1 Tax=Cicer arietinum TaxID=3827 RepID=A0A3Q7XTY0_CICAR|nr:uncharacterized protein LOC113785363 [Cicer arietinum]